MKRLTLILSLLFLFLLTGCDSLLSRTYYSSSLHIEQRGDGETDAAPRASSYAEIKEIILQMLEAGKEEGEIRFYDFPGEVKNEVPKVCKEIMNNEPLGAYLVDYFISDYAQMLSYTSLNLTIVYYTPKRTVPDKKVFSLGGLTSFLEQGLEKHTSPLVYEDNFSALNEAGLLDLVYSLYLAKPDRAVCRPVVKAVLYPDAGRRRIVEMKVEYELKSDELDERIAFADQELEAILQRRPEDWEAPMLALWLHDELIRTIEVDPSLSEALTLEGDNLYTALHDGRAHSEGFALCYAALCARAGLEVQTVPGRRSNHAVTWNRIKLDDEWYHVDVGADAAESGTATAHTWFLMTDEQMLASTQWAETDSVVCDAQSYTYTGMAAEYAQLLAALEGGGVAPSPDATPS